MRTRALVAVVATVVLVGASGACTPSVDPTAPTGLRAWMTTTGFEVTWSPMNGATGFAVRSLDLTIPDAATVSVEVTEPRVSITGLIDGHRYQIWVKARGVDQSGSWSTSIRPVFVTPALPSVSIVTDDSVPITSKEIYVHGQVTIDSGDGTAPVTTGLQIRGRGNSTWTASKKPYRVKLDESKVVLGMPKSKHWVLLADYFDATHLRNQTALTLGRQTDLAWTPRLRQVEVILNGVYQGVYALVEHLRIAGDRVDIDEMTPSDIAGDELTGGYLAEIDHHTPDPDKYVFRTPRNQVTVDNPEEPTPEQATYITDYVRSFETALYSAGFADPVAGYRSYLDVDAMVDYYLVSELTRNQDAFHGSAWFHKPRLGLLTMGPLWDFDNSLGNNVGWESGEATGWYVRQPNMKWIGRLFDDPAFAASVEARWAQLKPAFEAVADQVLVEGAALAPALAHDRLVWQSKPSTVDTYEELADWLHTRIDWLDEQFVPPGIAE